MEMLLGFTEVAPLFTKIKFHSFSKFYRIILPSLPSAQNNEYIHVLFRHSNAFFLFSPSFNSLLLNC